MKNKLSRDIINTLCYYDALNYPLTSFEIWKFLTKSIDRESESFGNNDEKEKLFVELIDVINGLDDDELKRTIESKQGFYFLRGREELVSHRIRKNKTSSLKIKKLRNVIKILKFVPFVRMILVTGKLSMKNATVKSDWDLLVVLEKGKIWTGRTLVTAVVHFLGKRRYGKKIKDRVCLNHFITTKSLEICDKNLFSANEYMCAISIFDSKKYYEEFQLRNHWISQVKTNFYVNEMKHIRFVFDTELSKKAREIFEKFFDFDWLENFLRKIEKQKIENNPKTKMKGSFIDATDKALIFLPSPQGPRIFEKYHKKLEKIRIN
ncbi:MAG: hypothetical protein OEV93_02700 [Candidatus Moranbacteria bacterium]|nr:hypothetical protein [Candidatus Moranbacteria bacterium]